MRSADLSSYGFEVWRAFSRIGEKGLLSALPEESGVYAIRCCREYGRVSGTSDILYFGSATNQRGLRGRVRQYFHPGPSQRTNRRILKLVGECSDFEISFVLTACPEDAKRLETTLLETYESEHGELPPENRRG